MNDNDIKEFKIPIEIEALIKANVGRSEDRYFVSPDTVSHVEGFTPKMLENLIITCAGNLRRDPLTILDAENFDSIFAALRIWKKIEPDARDTLAQILESTTSALQTGIEAFKNEESNNDDVIAIKAQAKRWRCAFKMIAYLLYLLYISAERDVAKAEEENEVALGPQTGRSKKKKQVSYPNGKHWSTRQEQLLGVCSFCLDHASALQSLWPSRQPEEDLLKLFREIALTTLMSRVDSALDPLRNGAFSILALLVIKYNNGIHLKPSLFNAIQKYNHISAHWDGLLSELLSDRRGPDAVAQGAQFISHLLTGINIAELSCDGRDATVIENTGRFFSALATISPTLLMKHLSELHRGLSNPEYRVRNFVLETFGQLYRTQQTNQLSDLLVESLHDQNSQVRSKVTKVWSEITIAHQIPVEMFATLSKVVVGRLEDSASNVRKGALNLLANLMKYNPFGSNLELPAWLLKQREMSELAEGDESNQESIQRCSAIVEFIQHLHHAIDAAIRLLSSVMPADIQSAIKFLCSAKDFVSSQADRGLRKMTSLIWSTDESVVKSLLAAYQTLYFSPSSSDTQRDAMFLAIKLVQLPQNASAGEIESLTKIFAHRDLDINQMAGPIFKVLLAIFEGRIEEYAAPEHRKAALVVLTLLHRDGQSKSNEALQKIFPLLKSPDLDPDLLYWCLLAIQKLFPKKDASYRLPPTHSLCSDLMGIILRPSTTPDQWLIVAEAALNTLYLLAESPDSLAVALLHHLQPQAERCSANDLLRYVFASTHIALKHAQHLEDIKSEITRRRTLLSTPAPEAPSKSSKKAPKTPRARKGKAAAAADAETQAADDELESASNATQEERDEQYRAEANNQILDQNNLIGAVAPPLIVHLCLLTCKILNPSSAQSLQDEQFQYSLPPLLQRVASIGLGKLMLIDQTFCDDNLPLLFSLLELSSDPIMRANLVIAIGDLFMNHTNSLGVIKINRVHTSSDVVPRTWTERLFDCLNDPSARVRRSTLMIVNRLVLKSMIKVRELMYCIAKCLLEEDPRIVNLARHFFVEQSKRTELANALPAIITPLVTGETLVTPQQFQEIAKFLFSQKSLETERQSISFVLTFCDRLKNITDRYEAWNYAFCISSLHFTEKVIKQLIDRFKEYSQQLIHPEVWQCFQSVLTKAKLIARSEEMRLTLEEWEKQMTAAIGEGPLAESASSSVSGPATSETVEEQQPKAAAKGRGKTPARGRATRTGRGAARNSRAKPKEVSSEDEAEEQNDSEEEEVIKPTTARRSRANRAPQEADDEASFAAPSAKRTSRARSNRTVIQDEESEEEQIPTKSTRSRRR